MEITKCFSFSYNWPKLRCKFKLICLIMLMFAMIEHTYCIAQTMMTQTVTNLCNNSTKQTISNNDNILFFDRKFSIILLAI